MKKYDVIIVGAGAAGLMSAVELSKRKKNILIIDMGKKLGRKIEISGGGKCNFTNTHSDYSHYFGKNPRFVCSALSQFSPQDTLNWVKSHNIDFYEKEPGRYFCTKSSYDIINAFITDIKNTEIKFDTKLSDIIKTDNIFTLKTNNGNFLCKSVIIATGGMSYSHLGASETGHIIAKKFGHKIEPVRPGLCAIKTKSFSPDLSGISLMVEININKHKIKDNLLFTHFGIGGPAIYRASLLDCKQMHINFAPNINVFEFLKSAKQTNGKKSVANILSKILPNKLAHFLCKKYTKHIADYKDIEIQEIANKITKFEITDGSAIGMQSA